MECIKILLTYGYGLSKGEIQGRDSGSPLPNCEDLFKVAMTTGNLEVVKVPVDAGIYEHHEKALEEASRQRKWNIMHYLIERFPAVLSG